MRKPTITFWRRLTQWVSFALLVYGGWAFAVAFGARHETDSLMPKDSIVWTQGHRPVVNTYLPSAVCRFTARGRVVRGCIIELLSDSLTLAKSMALVLPYLLAFVALSFLVGRMWCGWVCPLGGMGDLLSWIRQKAQARYLRMSARLRSGLRWTNYSLFGATLGISWLIRPERYKATYQCWFYLPFCQLCPARLACPLVAGAAPTSWWEFTHPVQAFFTIASWATLAFFAAAFLSARRLWCHVCPIGLATSWFNRGGALTLTKEAHRCNRCGACADACPMGLTHVRDEKRLTAMNIPECIYCLRCVDVCPKDDCLKLDFLRLPVTRSRLVLRRASKRMANDQVPNPQQMTKPQ